MLPKLFHSRVLADSEESAQRNDWTVIDVAVWLNIVLHGTSPVCVGTDRRSKSLRDPSGILSCCNISQVWSWEKEASVVVH